MGQVPEGMHRRKAYRDRLGRWYPEKIKNNPRRPRNARSASPPPPSPSARGGSGFIVGLTITAAVGAVVVSASLGGGSGPKRDSLSVQVKVDLTQTVATLASLEFHTVHARPKYGTSCAASATGDVKNFLENNLCKEYASTIFTARRERITTKITISWVVMGSVRLARKYKAIAGIPRKGNPPGQPPLIFNGFCYASGRNGATVWSEQVKPTGSPSTDQEILQAAAPVKLSVGYLQQHCIE